MLRGVWHQFGSQTEIDAQEMLKDGVGEGAILSPMDLDYRQARGTALGLYQQKKGCLFDPQFYDPSWVNPASATYPTNTFRGDPRDLTNLSDAQKITICDAMKRLGEGLYLSGLIAPSLLYDAGSSHLLGINRTLFDSTRQAADSLQIPAIASVPIGPSLIVSDSEISRVLSWVTSFGADAYYLLFDFDDERIPTDLEKLRRCAMACLSLAGQEKPVLFGFAGLTTLPIMAWGVTAVGIGPHKTLHQFRHRHFNQEFRAQAAADRRNGASGGRPATLTYFSRALWTGLTCPDETALVAARLPEMASQIIAASPYASTVIDDPATLNWTLDEAHKHFHWVIAQQVDDLLKTPSLLNRAKAVLDIIDAQISAWDLVMAGGVSVRRGPSLGYWSAWRKAIIAGINNHADEYDWLDL